MELVIVGMLSSYREGRLAELAVRGLLEACDVVLALEGPVGDAPATGDPSVFHRGRKQPPQLLVREHAEPFASDARKRTELLRWARTTGDRLSGASFNEPQWGVVVDGDEELICGYALPAYLDRAAAAGDAGTMKLKVCEADGQVHESGARCLPLRLVEEFVISGHVIRLAGHASTVTLPLQPASKAPIIGEPHILHRSYLRPPDRAGTAQRLSASELDELRAIGVKL